MAAQESGVPKKMIIPITFEFEVPDVESLKKMAIPRAHKHAVGEVMNWFKDRRMHLHFNDSLQEELNYEHRSSSMKKRRKWKEIRSGRRTFDHNYSGLTFHRAKRGIVKATYNRRTGLAKGSIRFRAGIQYRARNKVGPPMRKELTSWTDEEVKMAANIYREMFVNYINTNPGAKFKHRRKVRG